MPTDTPSVLAGYAAQANTLKASYATLNAHKILAPVLDLLPKEPAQILDIGAGTGRDALWLADQGHKVTAVEPIRAFWPASGPVVFLEDRLPNLRKLCLRQDRYHVILTNAVWHHLTLPERTIALPVIKGLLRPLGLLIVSLRHGPCPADRPGFAAPPANTIHTAQKLGLSLVRQAEKASHQPGNQKAGVSWTWLAFRKLP